MQKNYSETLELLQVKTHSAVIYFTRKPSKVRCTGMGSGLRLQVYIDASSEWVSLPYDEAYTFEVVEV